MSNKIRENKKQPPSIGQTRTDKLDNEKFQVLNENKTEIQRKIIEILRVRIREIWQTTLVDEATQNKFTHLFNDRWSDYTLHEHDEYLKRMEDRNKTLVPVLELVKRLDDIHAEKLEFDRTSNDPGRFKVPGRVLYEENFRKTLKVDVPNLEAQLKRQVQLWEHDNGPLFLRGKRILAALDISADSRKKANTVVATSAGMAPVDRELEEAKHLQAAIVEMKERVASLRKQMGVPHASGHSTTPSSVQNDHERWVNMLQVVEEQHHERTQKVQELLDHLQLQLKALGQPADPTCLEVGADVSDARQKAITDKIDRATADLAQRNGQMSEMVPEMRSLIAELALSAKFKNPQTNVEESLLTPLDVTILDANAMSLLSLMPEVMNILETRRTELLALQTDRRHQIEELGVDIDAMFVRLETTEQDKGLMWARLNVPLVNRDEYFSNSPPTLAVINALKAEYALLDSQRMSSLERLIQNAKRNLTEVYDDVLVDKATRDQFAPFNSAEIDLDILNQLEAEKARLIARGNTLRPLLDMNKERNAILSKNAAFEAQAERKREDEERQRIVMTVDIAALEKKMKLFAYQWEATQRDDLILNGTRFIDQLQSEIATRLKSFNAKLAVATNAVRAKQKQAGLDGSLRAQREVQQMEKDLVAMADQKELNLKLLISEIRESIFYLWDNMLVDDKTRKDQFPFAFDDANWTDFSVAEHDRFSKHLKKRLETMLPALRLYKERAQILEEKASTFDIKVAPSATRLAYEEHFRDKLKYYLPKLEANIKAKAEELESLPGPYANTPPQRDIPKFGQLFYNGLRVVEEMSSAADARARHAAAFREIATKSSSRPTTPGRRTPPRQVTSPRAAPAVTSPRATVASPPRSVLSPRKLNRPGL